MRFEVDVEKGRRMIEVEPFLMDIRREVLHCPWCHESLPVPAMRTTLFSFLRRTSHHIHEVHPDKDKGVAIGFLLAEPG